MITVSAPGKLMLFGEHAVVYGYPCLVTAVSQRLGVLAEKTHSGTISIDAPQVKDTRFVSEAINNTLEKLQIKHDGILVTTQSPFSGIYGFGSSSAVTAATIKAVSTLFSLPLTDRELFDIAYKTIMNIQGVGSGFDVASAVYGGTLYFVSAGSVIEPVGFITAKSGVSLVVGYSGVKSNTVEIVNQVAEKRRVYRDKVDRIFTAISKIVEEAKDRIAASDWERVGKLMDFNQEYLRNLGVSSGKLEDMIMAAKSAGAFGAKLSGAGGGDCMITLVPDTKRSVVEGALTKAGGQVVDVAPHEPGARVETTDDQQEMFVVVDKDDNVIGFRTRSECHHDKSLIHRTVGVIIYDDAGRVLLQKRSLTKDTGPGMWGISSAGHIAKGQSEVEAVHRELQEELGLDLPLTFVNKFVVEDDIETEMSYLYKAKSNGPFKPDLSEVERVEFFSPREILLKSASGEIPLTKGAYVSLQKAGILV